MGLFCAAKLGQGVVPPKKMTLQKLGICCKGFACGAQTARCVPRLLRGASRVTRGKLPLVAAAWRPAFPVRCSGASSLARCLAVPCGVRQRTLRRVLEYLPQSTIRRSARPFPVSRPLPLRFPDGGAVSSGRVWGTTVGAHPYRTDAPPRK